MLPLISISNIQQYTLTEFQLYSNVKIYESQNVCKHPVNTKIIGHTFKNAF